MFDLGWTEMMLIGVVALIVVGPKELPGLFRTIGNYVGRARGMAREFSRAMEAAADEAGVKDIDRTIRAAARPAQFGQAQMRSAMGFGAGGPAAKAAAPAPVPAPGKPLDLGPSAKPATDALAATRAEERARLAEEAAARAEARAEAAEARASQAEARAPDAAT